MFITKLQIKYNTKFGNMESQMLQIMRGSIAEVPFQSYSTLGNVIETWTGFRVDYFAETRE